MNPIELPCTHGATEAEQERDPEYMGCLAHAHQPCIWARRRDGGVNPPFHSERIEAAVLGDGSPGNISREEFEQAVEADDSLF